MSNSDFKSMITSLSRGTQADDCSDGIERRRAPRCCIRKPTDRGYYPPVRFFAGCDRAIAKVDATRSKRFRECDAARVYDVAYSGRAIRRETRRFEWLPDAVDYARDRVPVGEAFAVVFGGSIIETFGSKVALRAGGWL